MTTPATAGYAWPPLLPDQLDAILQATADRLGDAWDDVLTEQARLLADVTALRRDAVLATLQELLDSIDVFRGELEAEGQAFARRTLPGVYANAAQTADVGVRGLAPFRWNQPHVDAVLSLSADSYGDFLERSRAAGQTSDAFAREVRRLARKEIPRTVTRSRSAVQQGRELARRLEERGLGAVTYRDGSKHHAREWALMATRTKTAVAHNAGSLNRYAEAGVRYVECFDGADCGWVSHQDVTKANGRIVTLADAAAHPISHPNCRRAFGARPDLGELSPSEAARRSRSTTPEQRADQAAFERGGRVGPSAPSTTPSRSTAPRPADNARARRAESRQARTGPAPEVLQAVMRERVRQSEPQVPVGPPVRPPVPSPAPAPPSAPASRPAPPLARSRPAPARSAPIPDPARDMIAVRMELDATVREATPWDRSAKQNRLMELADTAPADRRLPDWVTPQQASLIDELHRSREVLRAAAAAKRAELDERAAATKARQQAARAERSRIDALPRTARSYDDADGEVEQGLNQLHDMRATNPGYLSDPAYSVNCVHVVATYELRRRGFDVEATPLPKPNAPSIVGGHVGRSGRDLDEAASRWTMPDGRPGRMEPTTRARLTKEVDSWPAGARGFVRIAWGRNYGGGGHVFSVEKLPNGETRWVEAQKGTLLDHPDEYLSRASSSGGALQLARVDQWAPSDMLLEFLRPRKG